MLVFSARGDLRPLRSYDSGQQAQAILAAEGAVALEHRVVAADAPMQRIVGTTLVAAGEYVLILPPRSARSPARLFGDVYGLQNDKRVKCLFEVSNPQSSVHFNATLLIDDGAMSELTLPARKIIQLGLMPAGLPTRAKGSGNHFSMVYTLVPQVLLKATFIRDGQPEEIQALLECKVYKDEFDAAMAARAGSSTRGASASAASAASPVSKKERPAAPFTPPRAGAASSALPPIKLSPIRHRADLKREDRVVIGANGAAKLGFKINVKDCCLELEEVELEQD